jgi:hypothetical protein
MSGKILNKVQAQTIYNMMCEANNIYAKIRVTLDYLMPGTGTNVFETINGFVRVVKLVNFEPLKVEVYQSQDEFRSKYGLAV